MTLATIDAKGCWPKVDCNVNCQERFVVNAMQNFPPRQESIVRCQLAYCVRRDSITSLSRSCCQRRCSPGQRMLEQLLSRKRKQKRLLVPDLATEWYRKQKVFLDTVTWAERLELKERRGLEDSVVDCDCKSCGCLRQAKGSLPCVQYLKYTQELRRRRLLLQRQRQQRRLGERCCGCHHPMNRPIAMRAAKNSVQLTELTDEQLQEIKSEPELLAKNLTICKSTLADCAPETSADGAGRIAAGSAGAIKPKIYIQRTCSCLRPKSQSSCACCFQADGQPMAEECVAAKRGRSETPLLGLRKKYNLREASRRRLDPACFRRISPEFYSLLKSYEDCMIERYPLYGLPIRYWNNTNTNCYCEKPSSASMVCAEPCLGDQSLAITIEQTVPKSEPPPIEEKGESTVCDSIACDPIACDPVACDAICSTQKPKCSAMDICKMDNTPAMCVDACTIGQCRSNRCPRELFNRKHQQSDHVQVCRRETCPTFNKPKLMQARHMHEHCALMSAKRDPKHHRVVNSTTALPAQPKENKNQKTSPQPVNLWPTHQPWFFIEKKVGCVSSDDCSSNLKRKGILGSVAGLCKRVMLPGRYLLYSLSNLSRTPTEYNYGQLAKKKQKPLSAPPPPPHNHPKQRRRSNEWENDVQPAASSSGSRTIVNAPTEPINRQELGGQYYDSKSAARPDVKPKIMMVETKPPIEAAAGGGSQGESIKPLKNVADVEQTRSEEISPLSDEPKSSVIRVPAERELEQTFNPEPVQKEIMRKDRLKPSVAYRLNHRHYVPASDYMQLMRLVARKRAKTRKSKRHRVTFADKLQVHGSKPPLSPQHYSPPIMPKTPPRLLSPGQSRSPSPVPRKQQREPWKPAQDDYPAISERRREASSRNDKYFKPHSVKGEDFQAQSLTWYSLESESSAFAKDQLMSDQRHGYTSDNANRTRANRHMSNTHYGQSPDNGVELYYSEISTSESKLHRNKTPPPIKQKPRLQPQQRPQQQPQQQQLHQERTSSADSFERRARFMMELRQGQKSNDTSMDTVAHDEERLANITRYTEPKLKSHKSGLRSLSKYLFTTKPPINEKLIRMREEMAKGPKSKLLDKSLKPQGLMQTHEHGGPSQAGLEHLRHDSEQPSTSGYRRTEQVQGSAYRRQDRSNDYKNRYDYDSDNDNQLGRHNPHYRRARSGCDVQFADNNFNSNSIGAKNHILNPSRRTRHKGYATPSNSESYLRSEPSESSSSGEVRRIERQASGQQPRRTEFQTMQLGQRHRDRVLDRQRGLRRPEFRYEAPNPISRQLQDPGIEHVHTGNWLKKDVQPAFSESFSYPERAQHRSHNSIEGYRGNRRSMKWTNRNDPDSRSPSSILKSSLKSARQAQDFRRVNFLSDQRSNANVFAFNRSSVISEPTLPYSSYPNHPTDRAATNKHNELKAEQPHSFSFQRPKANTIPSNVQMGMSMSGLSRQIEHAGPMPSLFAMPTTVSSSDMPRVLRTYALTKKPQDQGHTRLRTQAKTPEELELEESRLPMNSELLTKRHDIPSTRRYVNERPHMPPGVSLVSDLDFTTHVAPSRNIVDYETRECGGDITKDMPLLLSTVLHKMQERQKNRASNPDRNTPAYCQSPHHGATTDNIQSSEERYRRQRYPCYRHDLLGNTEHLKLDKSTPKRRCCLRRLPEEPVVIEPTHVGLRVQQMKQTCLPTLFYGRNC